MSETLPSQYDPTQTEAKWQQYWEEHHVFKADPEHPGEPYCVVIPPPNVTGSLHMGHAFDNTLIDILVRYHRMTGRNTLYLPGTDHASIAVHVMVERELKAENTTRYDLGREKFLERAWQWKEKSKGTIVGQLRRLGVSVDWTRERFTLDDGLSKAVAEAFVRLYDEGLIYRGEYLVNWCPESQSAVSDLEVDNQEVEGHLWHFRYPLTDGSGFVEVATTRPETMLGDTAVAVNPKDTRYQNIIGKTVTLPIMNREIPIVGDEYVDMEFGTGCVKVTPAHDLNDFEIGKRHDLPFINIMNKDGTLNANAGEFEGQDRFVARKNVVARLEADGCLVKVEDYKHSVPYSERGKVPVEPLLSTQWYVKIRPMADRALDYFDGQTTPEFFPSRWGKVYRDWLVRLKDWCISRQLWWGHQIPAWYAVSETGGELTDETPFVVARNDEEAREKAIAKFGETVQLQRDADVLDTWFSSGLWPFSTMGWPQETPDLAKYFPGSVLVTGFDIIFFWVARMTMMAGHFTGQMPFKDVYIHGLVLDEKGQKMSKTKGNGIDPLLLMDRYGTDALRYTLVKEVVGVGQDIRLDYDRQANTSASVEASRNFANKLWNAARFVMMHLGEQTPQQLGEPIPHTEPEPEAEPAFVPQGDDRERTFILIADFSGGANPHTVHRQLKVRADRLQREMNLIQRQGGKIVSLTPCDAVEAEIPAAECLLVQGMELSDRWILSRFHQTVRQTRSAIEAYGLGEAVKGLYEFIWGDFCDWYIELVKSRLQLPKVDATQTVKQLQEQAKHYRVKSYSRLKKTQLIAAIEASIASSPQAQSRRVAQQTLAFVLDGILRLLHPFLPHITEEIWHTLTQTGDETCLAIQAYPQVDAGLIDAELEQDFDLLIGAIRTLRNLRAEIEVKPGAKVEAILQSESDQERDILISGQSYIKTLAKVEQLTVTPALEEDLKQTIAGVVGTVQILIPLAGVVDVAAIRTKLEKSLAKVEAEISSVSGRLNNANFVNKAKPDVVEGARNALAEAQKQAEILRDRLSQLQ
jgi:valyl-tRNA synthetase